MQLWCIPPLAEIASQLSGDRRSRENHPRAFTDFRSSASGLRWMSGQHNSSYCYVFFDDVCKGFGLYHCRSRGGS